MVSSVVDFPAPFGPSRATTSPVLDVEVEPADGRDPAVAGDESLDDDRAHTVTSAPR